VERRLTPDSLRRAWGGRRRRGGVTHARRSWRCHSRQTLVEVSLTPDSLRAADDDMNSKVLFIITTLEFLPTCFGRLGLSFNNPTQIRVPEPLAPHTARLRPPPGPGFTKEVVGTLVRAAQLSAGSTR
jgi:hypothetical protein